MGAFRYLAGLMIALVVLVGGLAQARATLYTLSGTCDSDCVFVGLNDGDPVSGVVKVTGSGALTTANFAVVDLSIGNGDILDSTNPVGDGRSITATTSGSTFSDITIAQPTGGGGFSDIFFMPGSGGADWELSLSGSPLAQKGTGSWTQETTTAIYDFTGTCEINCDFVLLNPGDPVSASVQVIGVGARSAIYYDLVDLQIGTFGLLDSLDPFGDGLEIASTVTGATISDFFIGLPIGSGFSDVFFTPGGGPFGWELSASAAPNAVQGDGQWALRAAGGPGPGPGPGTVPEPATLALLAFGLAGLGFMRRRKAP